MQWSRYDCGPVEKRVTLRDLMRREVLNIAVFSRPVLAQHGGCWRHCAQWLCGHCRAANQWFGRCSGQCQHGHFSASPCRERCRKAKNHGGAHDCMRHARTPKLPPPVPRVWQGATTLLGSHAVMMTTTLLVRKTYCPLLRSSSCGFSPVLSCTTNPFIASLSLSSPAAIISPKSIEFPVVVIVI